jgi:2'-5' RNA ligase
LVNPLLARQASDAYARVWGSFQASPATEDGRHDTPHWRSHTGPYALCVARVPAETLSPALGTLRHELSTLHGVRLHPDYFLHITLQELGFVVDPPTRPDEISSLRLEEFAQSIVDPVAAAAPFTVKLGGANAFRDAVFLEVQGGERLILLHERLFDLAAIPRSPAYPYLPHCTLAHFDGTTPVSEAAEVLAPWHTETFGQLAITEVEIVTLDPAETYPEMESFAVIPLGN